MARFRSRGDAPAVDGSPRRGAAREHAILDAALELIGEVGYERITVDSIAARAHASKTTMYRRWPGKAALVADALRRHAQGDAPAIPDSGSLRTDLLLTVRQIAETLTGPRRPVADRAARGDPRRQRPPRADRVPDPPAQPRSRTRHLRARAAAVKRPRGPFRDVMDIAFAHVFTETLFTGGIPERAAQERLVDWVSSPPAGVTAEASSSSALSVLGRLEPACPCRCRLAQFAAIPPMGNLGVIAAAS